MIDPTQLDALVMAELSRLRASTAADLISGAPPRRLGFGALAILPYSNGRAGWVPIVLAADTLKVPVEIGLRFSVGLDAGGTTVIEGSPTRDELVIATRLAIDGERRAFEAAVAALAAAHIAPATTWANDLRVIRLDPRLPATQRAGPASWHLLFEPFEEARGGYHAVLMWLPTFTVARVQ